AHEVLRLAVPLALAIEVLAPHGGLVPEVDGLVYVRLRDGMGRPPSAPTDVTLEGPAVLGGRRTARTDVNGLAALPVRLPPGAASSHHGRPEATVLVTVAGPLSRTARVALPVLREADVAPAVARAVVEPGAQIDVTLSRRPRAETAA